MAYSIKFNGTKQLENALKKNAEKVKLVNGVLMQDTAELQSLAMKTVPVRTGDLKRSIGLDVNQFEGRVYAGMHYAPYVEYGTRFMNAQPYMKPSFDIVAPKFINHLNIVIGKDV